MAQSELDVTRRRRTHKMLNICTKFTLAVLCLILASEVAADSVRVEEWRGRTVIRLSGEIVEGVAEELASTFHHADIWPDGARVLLLDSLGGSVDEAFRVSEVIRANNFRTVVPNGASCASACASILFVAGNFRIVESFGRIGQHSCSIAGVPDQNCNEEIATHAMRSGVSHGSISAFMTFASPSEIIWFSREDVDGWGLSRYPGEEASGFEKSEPRVWRMITGETPPAQSAWRLDFHGDGYRAFVRSVSDAEREMQLNIFCYQALPGRLFLSMEINGDANTITNAILMSTISTDIFSWRTERPLVFSQDSVFTSVLMEIPGEYILEFLTAASQLIFRINLREPFLPIQVTSDISGSRRNLIFAANHCSSADYDLSGRRIQ